MTPAKSLQYNTIYNVMNTPISMWPWPHLRLNNIFPELLYKKIIENIPDETEITGSYKNKNDDNYQQNRYFLSDDDIEGLKISKKNFWKNFKIMMTDGNLKHHILNKIKHIVIADRNKNIFESDKNIKIYDTCNLTLELTGIGLYNHNDVSEKILKLINK